MKHLTENQIRRRAVVLSTAREMLAKVGYEELSMRDLAKKSGVALKTLYHYYENKEYLISTAVNQRWVDIHRGIQREEGVRGIQRLLFIIETIASLTIKEKIYARATLSINPSGGYMIGHPWNDIRDQTYRVALEEINEDKFFQSWVKVDLLTSIMVRTMGLATSHWAVGAIPDKALNDYMNFLALTMLQGKMVGKIESEIGALVKKSFIALDKSGSKFGNKNKS